MSDQDIADRIDEIIAASHLNISDAFVNQMLMAISTYNEQEFENIFNQSISHLGLMDTYLKVVYPLLFKVGHLWAKGDIIPTQEHFFSNLIRKKLFASIDSIEIKESNKQCWVLFLHQQENHEIGLLFANYLLRVNGAKVIYLGARVPFENLEQVINYCKPTHILTCFVKNHPPVKQLLVDMQSRFKKVKIFVAGNKEIVNEIIIPKGVSRISSPDELLNECKE